MKVAAGDVQGGDFGTEDGQGLALREAPGGGTAIGGADREGQCFIILRRHAHIKRGRAFADGNLGTGKRQILRVRESQFQILVNPISAANRLR